jgi:hypothetical protein
MTLQSPVFVENWCERARALRDAYYRLVGGELEAVVRYRGNEQEREVRYQSTDRDALRAAWKEAQELCEVQTGVTRPPRIRTIRLATFKGV